MLHVEGAEKAIAETLRRVRSGAPLSNAGRLGGLWAAFDSAAIAAGECIGRYPFNQLADFHNARNKRKKQVRSRLLLPLGMLLLALLVRPLPHVVAGELSAGEYLFGSIGMLFLLLVGSWLLSRLPGYLHGGAWGERWDGLVLQLPLVGATTRRRNLLEFARALGLLAQAGVALFDAMPRAIELVGNRHLRDCLGRAEQSLHGGASLFDALKQCPEFDPTLLALVDSGEVAGRVDEMLLHYVGMEEQALGQLEDMLVTWGARLVYLMVALWMAWSILSMGLPGPQ